MSAVAHVPLGEVCAINPRARKIVSLDADPMVSFVPMSAVDERAGEITIREQRPLSHVSTGYTSFENGDVLFAKITPCMENGKAALARNLVNGIGRGSTEFYVLRPGKHMIGEYLYHLVRRPQFRAIAKRSFVGTVGQQRVSKSFMENVLVPLPPVGEQRRVAGILDRAANIARLCNRANGCIPGCMPALFVKIFGDPVENQMGWPISYLGEICQMDKRGVQPDNPQSIGLPFVGMENVNSGTGILNFDTDSRLGNRKSVVFHFDSSHVLYGKLRPYLNKVATPEFAGICSTELVPLRPIDNVNRDFLAHLLRNKSTVHFAVASATGTRMPRTNMKVLMAMPVPLPPIELQQQFARIANRAQDVSVAAKTAADTASALTVALAARLLEQAL